MSFALERNSSGNLVYYKNVSIPFSASEDEFQTMLNSFDIFAPYGIRVSLATYDSIGSEVVAGSSSAFAYMWTVEIPRYRPPEVRAHQLVMSAAALTTTFDGVTPSIIIDHTLSKPHSIPLGGTFTLSYNGTASFYYDEVNLRNTNNINIPISVSIASLQHSLAETMNCSTILVEKPTGLDLEVTVVFIVSWAGCPGMKSMIQINSNNLNQGNEV